MKSSDCSKVLIRELKNREGYRKNLKDVELTMTEVWNNLVGVKGVRFDTVRVIPPESEINEAKHEMRDRWNDLVKERERILLQLRHIDDILKSVDGEIRETIEMVYCAKEEDRKTFEYMGRQFHISGAGLWYRVQNALENYCIRTH